MDNPKPKLRFDKLRLIKNSITAWDGLVAVLSQEQSDNLLLVYLDYDCMPEQATDSIRLISLDQFQVEPLEAYDSLVTCFSALDILRPDLLIRGPLFYNLERLFLNTNAQLDTDEQLNKENENRQQSFRTTSRQLANNLAEILPQLQQIKPLSAHHARFKLIRTALCWVLSQVDREGLVGLIAPTELANLTNLDSYRFIYLDANRPAELLQQLEQLELAPNTWIIAMHELAVLDRVKGNLRPEGPEFIELREVLRYSGYGSCLKPAIKNLSKAFEDYQDFFAHNKDIKDTFYYLKAQELLFSNDVDDLVALCFDRTVDTKEVVHYVYRNLNEARKSAASAGGLHVMSLKSLIRDHPCLHHTTRLLFTFEPISEKLLDCQLAEQHNLARILWYTEFEHNLARSLWLLYRDLLNEDKDFKGTSYTAQQQSSISTLELAIRAITIYGLWNPWEWRQGRWELDQESCYADLLRGLDFLTKVMAETHNPLEYYFKALGHWFSLYSSANVKQALEDIKKASQNFDSSSSDGLRDYQDNLKRLSDYLEELLYSTTDEKKLDTKRKEVLAVEPWEEAYARAYDLMLASVKDAAFNWNTDSPVPSRLFEHGWRTLLSKREELQQLFSQDLGVDDLINRLESLKLQLKNLSHTLPAPAHEKKLLDYFYAEELSRVENLLSELNKSAKINVTLENPNVFLNEWVDLSLRVTNQGKLEARNLEVTLVQTRGLQHNASSSVVFACPKLPSRQTFNINFTVRPVSNQGGGLQLLLTYKDNSAGPPDSSSAARKRNLNFSFNLTVKTRSQEGLEPEAELTDNPYSFGNPVTNPAALFGRRREIRILLSNLLAESPQNNLLVGPRRIGKTSVLLALKAILEQTSIRRLFEVPEKRDRELNRYTPVYFSLQKLSPATPEQMIPQFFRLLLDYTMDALKLAPESKDRLLELFNRQEKESGALRAAELTFDALFRLFPEKRVLMLLDEYDEIYRTGNAMLGVNLRDLVSQERRITWVISSTTILHAESKSSPWFNNLSIIELGQLEEKDGIALVERPSQGKLEWGSDAVLKLLKATGYRPAYTRIFCVEVFNYQAKLNSRYVLTETISVLRRSLVEGKQTLPVLFDDLWKGLRGVPRLILLEVSERDLPMERDELRRTLLKRLYAEPKISPEADLEAWFEKEFQDGMDLLEDVGDLLTKLADKQRRYTFSFPLFRDWLIYRQETDKGLPFDALNLVRSEFDLFRAKNTLDLKQ